MKKIMVAVSIMAAVLMTSCGGKQDVNGWYSDFAAAKKTAQAKNKNILLFVNSDFDDDGTEAGVKAVLSKEFSNALKGKYVLVHFDFNAFENSLETCRVFFLIQMLKLQVKNRKFLKPAVQ